MSTSRRQFLKRSLLATGSLAVGAFGSALAAETKKGFEISLAEWSLHLALQGKSDQKITNLDFARVAKEQCGIDAIEYVNTFFKDASSDYLKQLNKVADDYGVKQLLIMVDREGNLGDPDKKKRAQVVDNHKKWVDASKELGGHSIRVNARSKGSYDEQMKLAADGLAQLCEYSSKQNINVLVENHGGLSSNGAWLAGVMKEVDSPFCGTLPDFGNFRIGDGKMYDRYKGVKELMPWAKAVSAKSHDFDEDGNETHTDYMKMLKIVLDAGYHGYVGVEYEGKKLPEVEGIIATRKLLEKCRATLT
ncbi:Xylose isomerase-like TIM barrel [Planctomycetes bacterium Pan216]|uniref:Xylose isomerase-like TIM barrel n=1 Tax=Kolteria novifilia TaxID=2527975 RepID=A0A518BB08_9BACT|nr:Xylose isomerase-like TIM barrel [Planctomycetes bacterium Pan216]